MPDQATTVPSVTGDLAALAPSFARFLRASNRSERTVETYLAAVTQLESFVAGRGMPSIASRLTREHVEAFIAYLVESRSASTANNRFRALQQFFKFLVDEGEISEAPMRRMKPPMVPAQPVEVLSGGIATRIASHVCAQVLRGPPR